MHIGTERWTVLGSPAKASKRQHAQAMQSKTKEKERITDNQQAKQANSRVTAQIAPNAPRLPAVHDKTQDRQRKPDHSSGTQYDALLEQK
jgi:hypothetical protein